MQEYYFSTKSLVLTVRLWDKNSLYFEILNFPSYNTMPQTTRYY